MKSEMNLADLMIERAGLSSSILSHGTSDPTFDLVLQGIRQIHNGKEVLYGSYMETHGSDPTLFALMEHFADIKRKFVRAETFLKKNMSGQKIGLVELFDTYVDIAVYGALGVQLLAHLMTRELNEQTRSTDKFDQRQPDGKGFGGSTDSINRDHVHGGNG